MGVERMLLLLDGAALPRRLPVMAVPDAYAIVPGAAGL